MEQENGKEYIICGDLNPIMNDNEKNSGNFQSDPFRDKLELIMEANNLLDIQPRNGKYTWSNKRIRLGNIKEWLDRFLIHEIVNSNFNSVI